MSEHSKITNEDVLILKEQKINKNKQKIKQKKEIEQKKENEQEKKNEQKEERKQEQNTNRIKGNMLLSGIKLEEETIRYIKGQNLSELRISYHKFKDYTVYLFRGKVIDKIADYLSKFTKIAEMASQHNIVAISVPLILFDLDLSVREKYVLGKRIDISIPPKIFFKDNPEELKSFLESNNTYKDEVLIELKTLTGYEREAFISYYKRLHKEFNSKSNIKHVLWFSFFFKRNKKFTYFNKNELPNYYLVVIELMNDSIRSQSPLEISGSIDDSLKDILTEESKADFEGHVRSYDEGDVKSIDFDEYEDIDVSYFDNDYDRMATEYGFLVPVKNLLLVDTLREKIKEKDQVIAQIKEENEIIKEENEQIKEENEQIKKVVREKDKVIEEKDKVIEEKEKENEMIKKEKQKLLELLKKQGIKFEEN